MEWRKSLACALALAGMMAFGPGVRQAALAADTHNLTILGGGSGGLWAIISEGVGETLRRSMPNVRVTTEPGKDGPNQVMTSRGEVQFALATDVLTLKAIKGEAPFKGRKLDNLRLVAVMNPINALQFFVDAKTGAKSIQDIKDKKIPLRITVNRQGTLIDEQRKSCSRPTASPTATSPSGAARSTRSPDPKRPTSGTPGRWTPSSKFPSSPPAAFTNWARSMT